MRRDPTEFRQRFLQWKNGAKVYDGGKPIKNIVNKVRERLYKTINPLTDYNIIKNLGEFLKGEYMDYGDVGTDLEGRPYTEFEDATTDLGVTDNTWGRYLSIPKNARRFSDFDLQKSSYKPSIGGENTLYYQLPLRNYEIEDLVDETNSLSIGENKVSEIFTNYNLGEHTVGRGYDPQRGEYRSYYDKWDINPFSGKYLGTKIPVLDKLNDASFGIGKPVSFYDRIYMNDYHGMPDADPSIFLPEVIITAKKKHDCGKSIKPLDMGTPPRRQ